MMCENIKLYININCLKMKIDSTILSIVIIIMLTITSSKSRQIPKKQFVQINPTALNIMINAFDQVLVYFHNSTDQDMLTTFLNKYQKELQRIHEKYPQDHSIFGFINVTSDFKKDLQSEYFTSQLGFKLFNGFEHFQYTQTQSLSLTEFYEDIIHPKLNLSYQQQFVKRMQISKDKYYLVFPFSNIQNLKTYNLVYQKIFKHIKQFNIDCLAIPLQSTKSRVILYKENKKINQYSVYNRTAQQSAGQIIQSINIDTLPTLIQLGDSTFSRVFGGSVHDQILFIKHVQDQSVVSDLKQFQKAAFINRYESLAYQRVLFTSLSKDYFQENFNEKISDLNKDSANCTFTIIFTQTNYGRFQLKKYIFDKSKDSLKAEDIILFMQNIRLKKQEAYYKSQPIPIQQQNNNLLRKIVGNSFISQVFQKPQQSIIILFYDSKDENSHQQLKKQMQQFVRQYRQQIKDKLILAQFDLAKNEHKLLYMKQAPQLILFDKSNKKQSKYYKYMAQNTYYQLQEWIKRQVTNLKLENRSQKDINNDL